MMMIDYKALAERVAQRAIYADNNADQNNKTWAADLRTVVSLLNGMAGQKPFAWAIRDGWSQTRFSVDPDTPILGTRRADYVVDALYLHPAPAAPHGDASRMIDALQSIRAHVEHDPSALAAAIVATCDSVLDAAPQAEPMADSDADYWLRNRQPILDAIERAGFMLMSNASGFWLHPRGATEAQAEPKRGPLSDERIAEIQRAAYERAAQECIETAAELRRCADGCTDGRYDWKADGADDCADAIRALGRQHD